ncbi:MAG: undecaprenyldiphospho-muramoylpentapeptide beta-N-acetylglucosaminyltransferase [Bacteroidia bacterium]|nr:undecaprenyldiphospho-muramoylpentapeptide beta-N-acetylglucosaminyltransferase [Bacteroidia bacterium]
MIQNKIKVIISGGGTGGHIFPAISIANALKKKAPETEILFVGAKNRMEMEKIPAAGYQIIGLPISGYQRKLSLKNIFLIFKLFVCLIKSYKILSKFKPDVAVGVGGYASGPLLRVAAFKNIPCLIQEQNSYPGVTNKLLASRARKICVAYDGMERFFEKEKIILTGNPIRQDLENIENKKNDGLKYFSLSENKKILLVIGGSLGAKTINESIHEGLDMLIHNKIQVIWQTGKDFFDTANEEAVKYNTRDIKVYDFIARMDYAYSVADIVIARAGAITISELCTVRRPAILVPSPNVAEDHQAKNAMALIQANAAMLIPDNEAKQNLIEELIKLIKDKNRTEIFRQNIGKLAVINSADIIANEILSLVLNC